MADGVIFEFDVRVRFVDSSTFSASSQEDQGGSDPWISRAAVRLDADTLRRLEQLEPELMQWLAASPDNAQTFR